jgi:prophage regulatory protein
MAPHTKLMTANDVMSAIGIRARSTLWRMAKRLDLPPPVCIGKRSIRWRADQIEAWVESREQRHY